MTTGNVIMPSGSVNIGDETRISPLNSVVSNINDLLELPIRTGAGPPVSIRDIGSVSDSTDIPTAYALVNGRRAVYIPVTKRPNASTLDVVSEVSEPRSLSGVGARRYQGQLRAGSVAQRLASLQAVLREAALGALLTGLMVLLFLPRLAERRHRRRDDSIRAARRSDRPVGSGTDHQCHDAGRPALAVGILVDEATVAIENIHTHLARGVPVAEGCWMRAAK